VHDFYEAILLNKKLKKKKASIALKWNSGDSEHIKLLINYGMSNIISTCYKFYNNTIQTIFKVFLKKLLSQSITLEGWT
jgi:hypothetical protein